MGKKHSKFQRTENMGSGVRLIAQCWDFSTDMLSTPKTNQGHAVREKTLFKGLAYSLSGKSPGLRGSMSCLTCTYLYMKVCAAIKKHLNSVLKKHFLENHGEVD